MPLRTKMPLRFKTPSKICACQQAASLTITMDTLLTQLFLDEPGTFYFTQVLRMNFVSCRSELIRHCIISDLMGYFVWLEQLSRPSSQTN
eukprot:1147314-Pelagomonas_calceolata.AAC.2